MRLRQLRDEFGPQIEIEYRAFLLRPEDEDRQFTAYHLQHRRAARQMTGLPFDLPAVGTQYPRSSFPAHEAAHWVRQHHPAQFDAYDLALFAAFFEHTRDISDPVVLADVAREVEIDPAGLDEALQTRAHRDAVWAEYVTALDTGVQAIPTALIGGQAIAGAVPYEEYAQAMRQTISSEG